MFNSTTFNYYIAHVQWRLSLIYYLAHKSPELLKGPRSNIVIVGVALIVGHTSIGLLVFFVTNRFASFDTRFMHQEYGLEEGFSKAWIFRRLAHHLFINQTVLFRIAYVVMRSRILPTQHSVVTLIFLTVSNSITTKTKLQTRFYTSWTCGSLTIAIDRATWWK
jgi:hypothetical protein